MRTRGFVKELARELGCSQAEAERILLAFGSALRLALAREQYVRVKGLGRFKSRIVRGHAYRGFDGKGGEAPAHAQVTFSMSREMRDALREALR